MPFAKSRSRPDQSQRKAKLHKRIVFTNYAVPTGNLDSKTSQDVLGLLKVTSKRFHQTIVMITHNEEIAQMADRILQIEDGKIVSDSGLV
nr:MAG: putative ATPase of the ABC class [Bacteriophage sp.]